MLPVIFKALFFSCDNHGFLSAGYFSKIDICSRNPIIIKFQKSCFTGGKYMENNKYHFY